MFPDMIPKGYVDLNILNEVIRVQVGERELSKLSPKSKNWGWKEEEVSWPHPSD